MNEDQEQQKFRDILGFSEDMFDGWRQGSDFEIPVKHPPVAKQLQNTWMMNHHEPETNLIQNTGAGGDSYRVTPTGEISQRDFESEYYKLFMQERNPLKIAEYLKTRVDAESLKQTEDIWKKLSNERGLIGDYYVTVKPFDSCEDANSFFKTHNKQAKFVQKESFCTGCSYNQGKICGLTSKFLMDEIPYTDKIAAILMKDMIKNQALPKDYAVKVASFKTPKQKIQALLIYKYSAVIQEAQATPYTEAKVTTPTPTVFQDREKLSMVVEKLIKKGVTYNKIATKLGEHTGSSVIKEIIPEAVRNVSALNAVKFANCSDALKGNVQLLVKDASCSGCVFYGDTRCNKFKVSFIKDKPDNVLLDLGLKIKEAELKNKDYVVGFIAKCIDSGIGLVQMKELFKSRIDGPQLTDYVKQAVKKASKISAFKLSRCSGSHFAEVQSLVQDEHCIGCPANENTHCAKLKIKFSNVKESAPFVPVDTQQDLIRPSEILGAQQVVKVAMAKLAEGVSGEDLSSALRTNGFTPAQSNQIMREAISKQESINTHEWNGCKPSPLIKEAKRIIKTAACTGCVDNKQIKCQRYNKPFQGRFLSSVPENTEIEDSMNFFSDKEAAREIIAAPVVPTTRPTVSEDDLAEARRRFAATDPNIKVANQLLSSNIPLRDVIANLSKQGLDGGQIKQVLTDTFSSRKSINTVVLTDCQPSALFKSAQALTKTSRCAGCTDNQEVKCARFKKSFVNAQDHKAVSVVDSHEAAINDDSEWFTHQNGKPQMQDPQMDLDDMGFF